MKSLIYPFAFLTLLFAVSCDSDDPEPVNEEEVITTLEYTLSPANGDDVVMTFRDLDGDGGNAPVVTVSGNLVSGSTYTGSIILLNETEDPAENVTEEIEEEDDEHQFFFETDGVDLNINYADQDGDGNPVGLATSVVAGGPGSGDLTIILKHEPTKPASTSAEAGGETDIEVTFDVTVQ